MFFLSFILTILFFQQGAWASDFQLCPGVMFSEQPPFKFSDDEKRMLCGDKDDKPLSKPWADIPPSQAMVALKAMLQTRGYQNPTFTNQAGILNVRIGTITYSKTISVEGAPDTLDIGRKREITGEKLTPAKLNELQDWVSFELKHLGYPCPEVNVVADEVKGEILVHVHPGVYSKVLSIGADKVGDLHDGVVRRYDAFHVGDIFDIWNVAISETRATQDDLIVESHFNRICKPEGVDLYQQIQAGLPRLFNAGVGFDTELGPSFQIASHYGRMNQRGSSIDNSINLSYRVQEFTSTFNWYLLRTPSRFYLKPSFDLKRDKEPQYEYVQYSASVLPTYSWDDEANRWDVSLGPDYEDIHTVVGVGPLDSRNIFLNQSLVVTSHGYEYYMTNPQRGYKFALNSLTSNKSFASSVTASKFSLTGEGLWNVRNFAPPVLVLGLRGLVGTILTPNGSTDASNLPLSLRNFLGGSQDLRGFARQELPSNQPLGAMTEAYLGAEARFPAVLPYGIQPYTFIEAGELGSEPSTLQWPLYWDPGLGIRLASPVGSFRVEAAHGYTYSPTPVSLSANVSHWQFYFSYGEEF